MRASTALLLALALTAGCSGAPPSGHAFAAGVAHDAAHRLTLDVVGIGTGPRE